MTEFLREMLYPLGFVASIAFGGRFLWQWLHSEYHQKSLVTRTFWRLSLLGNGLLMLHALIQSQYHVCLIQCCNATISWRNLNMQSDKKVRFSTTVSLMLAVVALTTLSFIALNGTQAWFRIPTTPWMNAGNTVSLAWHLLGSIGLLLFASRFWVQWWQAEQQQVSTLGATFWWLSLVGHSLSLLYFYRIGDAVNIIGPSLGMIPYIRNLMLIYQPTKGAA